MAEFEADSYGAKLAAITDAQREGRLDASLVPADLLAQFRDAAVEAARRIIGA